MKGLNSQKDLVMLALAAGVTGRTQDVRRDASKGEGWL